MVTAPRRPASGEIPRQHHHHQQQQQDDEEAVCNVPSIVCAVLASLATGGNTYAFGMYGSQMKKSLRLSQSQLDTVSSAYFAAGLASAVPGWVVDRIGTRMSLVWAGIISSALLTAYWSVATSTVPLPSAGWAVPVLSCLGMLIFMANSLAVGAVFKTLVSATGPESTGSVVGAAKGFVGLGSGMYSCLFGLLQTQQSTSLDFLLMAAVLAITSFTIPALCLLPDQKPPQQEHSRADIAFKNSMSPRHLQAVYVSLVSVACVVVAHALSELTLSTTADDADSRRYSRNYAMALLLVGVWLIPLLSMIWFPRQVCRREPHHGRDEGGNEKLALLEARRHNDVIYDETPSLLDNGIDERTPDLNLIQMLGTVTAPLMLWTTTILTGGGTVITNNMGQMVESLQFLTPSQVITPISLAVFSVAQAASRVVTGYVSDAVLGKKCDTKRFCIEHGVPRPFFFVIASAIAALAHGVLSAAITESAFLTGIALSGVSFGMVWPLMVLVVGDVFGTKNHGANYLFFDGFSSAAGTLLLSKLVAQEVYERHVVSLPSSFEDDDDDTSSDGFTCMGSACFRMTHVVVSALCITCIGASFAIVRTSRQSYNALSRRIRFRT